MLPGTSRSSVDSVSNRRANENARRPTARTWRQHQGKFEGGFSYSGLDNALDASRSEARAARGKESGTGQVLGAGAGPDTRKLGHELAKLWRGKPAGGPGVGLLSSTAAPAFFRFQNGSSQPRFSFFFRQSSPYLCLCLSSSSKQYSTSTPSSVAPLG
jgi:hypothetical protein